jgi:3-dehydroquinate synthetase
MAERIEATLSDWGLPVRCPPFDVEAIWQAMAHDKKRRGSILRWILPHAIGEVAIAADVPSTVVKGVLRDLGASGTR